MQVKVNSYGAVFHGMCEDSVAVFRGIRYARYDRFREAVPVEADGDVDATRYGTLCPQRSPRLSKVLGKVDGLKVEEGSLCLSIFAPEEALNAKEKLPVMVWIHGGSYLRGGSEDPRYGAERLVRTGRLVVVKISYRLGACGYLWNPEEGIENLGLKDQKEGLRWVRKHIADFGGDPENVTVFSQSAGAHSAASLIHTMDEPLFSKVILQSPPLGLHMSVKKAESVYRKFTSLLGRDKYEAGIEEILDAQAAVSSKDLSMSFMPVLSKNLEPSREAVSHGVKVVAGYASRDASIFVMGNGKGLKALTGRILTGWLTSRLFSKPTERYVSMLKSAGIDAQLYRLEWSAEGNPLGSCHCIDLPFLLGDYDDWKDAQMLRGMTREEFDRNSRIMLDAWCGFANSGIFPEKLI